MSSHGDRLLGAAKQAHTKVFLVAPFIKVAPLRKIISATPIGVHIQIISRWIPEEIAAGACDLEILDLVEAREKTELLLHPRLHAKCYVFDSAYFMGSANLTNKALGWSSPTNYETLYQLDGEIGQFYELHSDLVRTAFRADRDFYNAIQSSVDKLRATVVNISTLSIEERNEVSQVWLPSLRDPSRLWQVYTDGEAVRNRIIESSYDAAVRDLSGLIIVPGLSLPQFRSYVASKLSGMQLIRDIDAAAAAGLDAASAISIITSNITTSAETIAPDVQWEILQDWLLYFFPNNYRKEVTSEVFRSGRIFTKISYP